MKHIAVVGGGISGIAATHALQQDGRVQVTLLEASSRLGGILETLHEGNYLIERSADNFSTLVPNGFELSKDCRIADGLIRPNQAGRRAFVLVDGRIHPIPVGFSLMQPTRVWPLLTTTALSWHGKLRVLREYWIPRLNPPPQDESLESFAVRRLGLEAFENLVEPIVSGIFTADAKTLSMAATMPQFLEMERTHGGLIRGYLASRRHDLAAASRRASGARYDGFVAPRHGMSAWIDGLARQIPRESIRLNTYVSKLERRDAGSNEAGWMIEFEDEDRSRHSQVFDGIILATPAQVASRLLASSIPSASQIIAGIPYASSVIVALAVHRADIRSRIDGFGLVVPRREQRSSIAISFASNKYPGRSPDDQILLRLFLGGALRPELVDRSDRQLTQLAYTEVREILGWSGKRAEYETVIRWKHAMPQYVVGHVDRVRQLRETLDSIGTVRVCGAAYDGVGIPQCIRSGQEAARQLLETL